MARMKTCVSLYSLQDEYLNKRMTLSDIMHFVEDLGAEGVEILPDQSLHGSPDISDETLEMWMDLVAETGLTPVIADVFLNTNLYKNRSLTRKECIDLLIREIKLADRLGIRMIRLMSMAPYWVIEPLLPYCKWYNVVIALEVHAGMAFDTPATRAFIEEMRRADSPYIGLVIDAGLFCRRFPRVVRDYEISAGTSPEIFGYLDGLFAQGTDLYQAKKKNGGEYPDGLKRLMKTEHDRMSAPLLEGYENCPFEALDEYMPHVRHIHLKMFEMTKEGPEYSVDYRGLLEYLHARGYDGYVSTEYEGNRFTPAGRPTAEKRQVAMNQAYIQQCLREIQGTGGRM